MTSAAAIPLRLPRELVDSEIRECPALEKFYTAAERLGKIVIVEEKKVCHGNSNPKN